MSRSLQSSTTILSNPLLTLKAHPSDFSSTSPPARSLQSRLPFNLPSGSSNSLLHCQSLFLSSRADRSLPVAEAFVHFDWGLAENLVRYGQAAPPPYSLEHVTCPVVLAWSDNDLLADPQVGYRGSRGRAN